MKSKLFGLACLLSAVALTMVTIAVSPPPGAKVHTEKIAASLVIAPAHALVQFDSSAVPPDQLAVFGAVTSTLANKTYTAIVTPTHATINSTIASIVGATANNISDSNWNLALTSPKTHAGIGCGHSPPVHGTVFTADFAEQNVVPRALAHPLLC